MGLFKKKKEEPPKEMVEYIRNAGGCIVTKSLLAGETRLKWLFREASCNAVDNGWRAIGADDTEDYINNSANLSICDFNTLANIEPAVLNVYEMPVGADLAFVEDASGKYFVDMKTGNAIREKVKSPFQLAFEQNLKFISRDGMEVDTVRRVFQGDARIKCHELGECSFPTGRVVVADPLCYLRDPKSVSVLKRRIPAGRCSVTLAIMDSELAGLRVAGAKLRITSKEAVAYKIADAQREEDGHMKDTFAGFPVETGTGCFCDEAAVRGYWRFLERWYKENPGKNIYDDYFKAFFEESYKKEPELQAEEGSFLIWNNPEDGTQIAMFSSGIGDGYYCDYWGLDSDGEICELVVIFMNPELF
ncbi:MAG: DUF2185 domain-containing protein [Roseburia sp.]|nr:DUF2185 domain-containing protein [Roseburia sp.]